MSPPLDRLLVPSGNDGVMTGHPDSTRDEAKEWVKRIGGSLLDTHTERTREGNEGRGSCSRLGPFNHSLARVV